MVPVSWTLIALEQTKRVLIITAHVRADITPTRVAPVNPVSIAMASKVLYPQQDPPDNLLIIIWPLFTEQYYCLYSEAAFEIGFTVCACERACMRACARVCFANLQKLSNCRLQAVLIQAPS